MTTEDRALRSLAAAAGVERLELHPPGPAPAAPVVVPLTLDGAPAGWLAADCCERPGPERLELLASVGAALAERRRLDRVGALKSNFIALASHELRAPASVVHGIAKTIEAHGPELGEERLGDLHATLVAHTERLCRLIGDLLDLSRLEAGEVGIAPERLPVRRSVERIVADVAAERTREVELEVDPELETTIDPRVLDRVLSNLLANALRYGAAPVRVRAHQLDRHFRLTVEDSGAGVEPSFVPRLFERFARADSARGDGSGLGLSIARSYAHAHGGQLLYEDGGPGARFQLVLPAPRR